jgi:DNA-directed RNA polymerase alpha subunit
MTRTRLIAAGSIVRQDMSSEDRLKMNLCEIGLVLRTINTLEREVGIVTVGQLLEKSEEELLEIPNFGVKTLKEVFRALENIGFNREPNKTKDGST